MSTTPGPWIAVEGTRGNIYIVQQESRVRIATVDGWKNGPSDAMLIAAAPALLACCKELKDSLAAAMRTIDKQGTDAMLDFISGILDVGIKNGVGVRAKDAIAAAEAPYKPSGAENLSSEGIK